MTLADEPVNAKGEPMKSVASNRKFKVRVRDGQAVRANEEEVPILKL